jgi:dephospho-CoA kinase
MPYKGLFLIGLTGGIAVGKSTVLAMLAEHGAYVIDADRVTHEVQRPGHAVYEQIVAAFGAGILAERGGAIDRKRLGAIVFADPAALRRLEQIVHPAVHAQIIGWLDATAARAQEEEEQTREEEQRRRGDEESGARLFLPFSSSPPIAVIDAVKLLEAGWKSVCDAVWVVVCPPEQQIARLVATRGLSEEEARTRIAAQPPQEQRAALADVVIDNGGTLDATRAQVQAAWNTIAARTGREGHSPSQSVSNGGVESIGGADGCDPPTMRAM